MMTYGSRGRPLAVGPAEEQDSFARACQKRWQRFEVTMFEPNPVSEMAIFGKREEGFQKFVALRSLFEWPATAD